MYVETEALLAFGSNYTRDFVRIIFRKLTYMAVNKSNNVRKNHSLM